jgi:hypothetical protein
MLTRGTEAIQINGCVGYLADCLVKRIYRDGRVCRIFESADSMSAGSLMATDFCSARRKGDESVRGV